MFDVDSSDLRASATVARCSRHACLRHRTKSLLPVYRRCRCCTLGKLLNTLAHNPHASRVFVVVRTAAFVDMQADLNITPIHITLRKLHRELTDHIQTEENGAINVNIFITN